VKKIPSDVERLMWLVAEDRDPRAIADFEARFPDLRFELSKRISMVNGLKKAGRAVPPHDIPRFVPRFAQPAPVRNRSLYVGIAFAVCALSFGAYSALSYFNRPSLPAVQVPLVNTEPPRGVSPQIEPDSKGQPGSTDSGSKNPDPVPEAGPAVAEADPLEKPITLNVERAPLEAAIELICMKAGLKYEPAPGMPQVEVTMSYTDMPARSVLDDLGRKYGFTALAQERGKILLIPVRPDGEQPTSGTAPTDGNSSGMKEVRPPTPVR
jgi:hypothetical protein